MKSRVKVIGLILLILAAISMMFGCSGSAPVERGTRASAPVVPATVDMGEITPVPAEEDPQPQEMPAPGVPDPTVALEQAVRSDLADRLDVDISLVETQSVREVEWPSAALGCPEPGSAYAQVVTAGYEFTLRAAGETYSYHTDQDGRFVLCTDDGRPALPLINATEDLS